MDEAWPIVVTEDKSEVNEPKYILVVGYMDLAFILKL